MPDKIPFQVGLTGGLGSGKTLVAKIFSSLGVPFYESDTEAKKLYFHKEVKASVIELLGKNAYLNKLAINSQWIAARIYENPELRRKLNAIIHPAVEKDYMQWLEKQTHPYVLKVAALVFEANIHKKMNMTLLVVSPVSLRTSRVESRDPARSADQIRQIIESQMSDVEKIKLADGLIRNDEKHSLIEQVLKWDKEILNRIA
jgi:dephospho-CoA kinase